MKLFPYEFDSNREVLFHPEKPQNFTGDILEVGPGRGDLLLSVARDNPQKKIVAVELGMKRHVRMIPRLKRLNLENVLLIRGDARLILPQFFSEGTFEKIFVLFPDPWPKERHAFRRLLNLEFLWLLTHLLKPNGNLVLATDVPEYADWILGHLSQIHALQNDLSPDRHRPSLPELPKTYFGEKWLSEGKTLHFMRWKKIAP